MWAVLRYEPTMLGKGSPRLQTPLTRTSKTRHMQPSTSAHVPQDELRWLCWERITNALLSLQFQPSTVNLGLWSGKDTWGGEQICRLRSQKGKHADHQEQGENAIPLQTQPELPKPEEVLVTRAPPRGVATRCPGRSGAGPAGLLEPHPGSAAQLQFATGA